MTGTTFQYPENRQLRICGIVGRELLAQPDMLDRNGRPSLVVFKDGSTTGLTVGRYSCLESFTREDGLKSIEIAIYNHEKMFGPFCDKGDSGSLIFDGLGRMVGLLHSGQSKRGVPGGYVAYATPIWWLIGRIKERYPHAIFDGTAWCL